MRTSNDSLVLYLQKAKDFAFVDTRKARQYITDAERLYKSATKNNRIYADLLSWKARIAYVSGDYVEAYQAAIDSYNRFDTLQDKTGMRATLKLQGLVVQAVGDNKEALVYFNKAIRLFGDNNDSEYVANLINIAISNIELKDYKNARTYLDEALVLSKKMEFYNYAHLAYNKLGIIDLEGKKYESAKDNFSKVLTHPVEPTVWEKAFAYNGLAKAYLETGNKQVALTYGLKGLYYAKNMDAMWDMQQSYQVLAGVYKSLGEFDTALNYYELSSKFKDSLFNQMRLNQLDLLELKKNEEEKKRLVAENEFMNEKLTKNNIFSVFILCVSVFLVALLAQHRKRIKRENELSNQIKLHNNEVEAQNETIQNHNAILARHNQAKDKLISILSHDLRSPVSAMEQLLELMVVGGVTEEEKVILLEELLIQVRSTSYMLNDLLKWAKLQLDGMEVNPVRVILEEKVNRTLSSFYLTLKRKEITVENHLHENQLTPVFVDDAHANIIIHNLISNAIKYTNRGNKIIINYEEEEDYVSLSVLNIGIVMKEEAIKEVLSIDNMMASLEGTAGERGEGLGLLLIKRFVKENHCKLNIIGHKNQGTEFVVYFPVFNIKN